jgi:hypothetical protein
MLDLLGCEKLPMKGQCPQHRGPVDRADSEADPMFWNHSSRQLARQSGRSYFRNKVGDQDKASDPVSQQEN